MKTIVVGYDESDAAKRALDRTADLAKAFGSTVVVTSVALLMAPAPRGGGVDPIETTEVHRGELEHAKAALADKGVSAEVVAAIGDPAEAILDVAKDRNADLIVVGTRELGAIGRLFGQSVSGAVARHAHCDVLIVH